MKGARIRYQQTGEFHFLTFSSYRRRAYLSQIAAMAIATIKRAYAEQLRLNRSGRLAREAGGCPSG